MHVHKFVALSFSSDVISKSEIIRKGFSLPYYKLWEHIEVCYC